VRNLPPEAETKHPRLRKRKNLGCWRSLLKISKILLKKWEIAAILNSDDICMSIAEYANLPDRKDRELPSEGIGEHNFRYSVPCTSRRRFLICRVCKQLSTFLNKENINAAGVF